MNLLNFTPDHSHPVLVGILLMLAGCATEPAPLPPRPPDPPPAPASVVRVDDIPSDAAPSVRAHLIRLRELRDQGKITEGDYQSRRALLLER
jgi:predicted component of type VI protein secretion system